MLNRNMHFGIISTGKISREFATALGRIEDTDITGVYSRSEDSARSFISNLGLSARPYSDVAELCAANDVDAVYIASPNSLHRDHALTAIGAGKHVIIEKPAVWNQDQWQEVWGAAKEAGVLVFEAARHIYEPAHQRIIEAIDGRTPASVRLNFSQYSSRWDAVLAGEEPNIFSLKHGGGALVDLGIYSVYAAVLWFGAPHTFHFIPSLAPTGVDASGTLVLNYGKFNVVIMTSKNAASDTPSEILFGRDEIKLTSVAGIDRATIRENGKERVIFDSGVKTGSRTLAELMQFEADFFNQMIRDYTEGGFSEEEQKIYDASVGLSRTVNKITTKARHSAGIYFEGEH